MIEIRIDKTYKRVGSNEGYTLSETVKKVYATKQEAKSYLKETYGSCKKIPSFIDDKNGNPIKRGVIYCYKTSEFGNENHKIEYWTNQDWVIAHESDPVLISL